jgi:hypothetical protein
LTVRVPAGQLDEPVPLDRGLAFDGLLGLGDLLVASFPDLVITVGACSTGS